MIAKVFKLRKLVYQYKTNKQIYDGILKKRNEIKNIIEATELEKENVKLYEETEYLKRDQNKKNDNIWLEQNERRNNTTQNT